MADRDLGDARIVPAARPVSSFVTPAQIQAAAPAKPSGIVLANNSAGLVSTAGRPNVPGYNPGQQLAEALSNFSTNLTKTITMGVELYATDQYQKGQNEVMKASMLAERQMDQSSVDYATANRQLAQRDPIAAMAMDQTNPFRHAGRQNALSQLAASEINTAMITSYRSRAGELALKDPTDPAINQVKADAINSITQRYGLDETSPGFAKHFLPAMNRAWERVTAQHVQDRNDYLKDTVWRTAGASIANGMRQARMDGRDLFQAATMSGGLLDQEAVRLGLPGEATDMKIKAIQLAQQQLIAAGEFEAARALGATPVGPPDESGYRATAAQLYGLELMEADDKYGEMRRRAQERELAPIREALSDEIASIGLTMEDGPGKLEAIQGILNKPEYAALPFADKLEAIGKANKLGEEVLGQGYDPTAAGNFVGNLDQAFGFGGKRDIKAAEAALQEALQRTAPEDRAALIQKFTDWKSKQQKQPWELINPAINNAIKANLEKNYPELGTAALRGTTNIEGILQWGDAKSKESSAAQLSIYRSAVLAALDEKRTQFGRDLTDLEAQTAIDKAIHETNKQFQADEALRNRAFPPVPGSQPDKPPPAPAGTKPSPVQGFRNPGTLDTLPDRETRLQNWRSQPVLDFQGTAGLTGQILNGGDFPAAFRRAAKDAGTTPEQLLIQQVDFYKNGLQLTPQQRNQILKKGNQAQALNDNRQARGTFGGSLASAANWMFDAVMGVRPAMASGNREIDLMRMYGGGGQPAADVSAFRAAIIGKESGGNYGAVNRDSGALGIGQVMPENVGPWTQRYLGRTLTPQQFLADRNAQDAVINGRFRDMLNDQKVAGYTGEMAVRRAAAIWYSGKGSLWNDTKPRYSNGRRYPSIADYTKAIWESYKKNGGRTAAPSSSAAPAVPAGWKAARPVASASGFGASESFRNGKGHEGMDLSFRQGTPLAFSVGGQVLAVYRTTSKARESNGGYGNYMDIKLDNGLVVRMAHLSQIPRGLATGSRFTAGQSIALSGGQGGTPGAGRSTGAHLHFEEHERTGIGNEETTKGKRDPSRRGGALDYLIWRG